MFGEHSCAAVYNVALLAARMRRSTQGQSEVVIGQSCEVRRVYGADALEAIDILREASLWTAQFGRPIWPLDGFTIEEHHVIAAAHEQVGGFEDSRMVACMRLQKRDDIFWPDDPPGEALYLHKLAVRRAASGKGWTARMVDWAVNECRKENARALRLDTVADSKLPAYYESLGFHLVDKPLMLVDEMYIVRLQLLIDG
jgi:GNAT superfamily N-acetyltransferase